MNVSEIKKAAESRLEVVEAALFELKTERRELIKILGANKSRELQGETTSTYIINYLRGNPEKTTLEIWDAFLLGPFSDSMTYKAFTVKNQVSGP